MGIAQLGQTITVVNKSGKVVSTSKHLVNVFKEAKAAYREKKAEITATRDAELEEKRTQRALDRAKTEDVNVSRRPSHAPRASSHVSRASSHASRTSSHASKRSHKSTSTRHARPPMERGYTDSFYTNDGSTRRSSHPGHTHSAKSPRTPRSPLRFEQDLEGDVDGVEGRELIRRHTDTSMNRRKSCDSIDMDLAYGELPPPLPARPLDEEAELRSQMTKLQQMLIEAKCLQYSATSTIENLQKNPEALAAVGLTLAEISNLASKMAPGALMAMKGSFPAIIALLASPQFLIAAGVGVGVTVVMLGGYKIIKKMKLKKEDERERELEGPIPMQELDTDDVDLSRIEQWRRGIAEAEEESPGSTVDGEFITPMASDRLIQEGVMRPDDLKSTKSSKTKKSKSKAKDDASVKAKADKKDKKKEKKKEKEPSGIKMLFKKHTGHLATA